MLSLHWERLNATSDMQKLGLKVKIPRTRLRTFHAQERAGTNPWWYKEAGASMGRAGNSVYLAKNTAGEGVAWALRL